MSVTTSARFNVDILVGLLPAGAVTIEGVAETATAKKVSHSAATDAAVQAALTTAAGQFVDTSANQAALRDKAAAAVAANLAFLNTAKPATAAAQASAAYDQAKALTRQMNAVLKYAVLQDFTDLTGT